MILQDKFLSQCASDITIKLQQLQQQGPAASLDEMVQTAPIPFITEQEREAKAQERERENSCPDAGHLPGKPYGKPMSLKDKA